MAWARSIGSVCGTYRQKGMFAHALAAASRAKAIEDTPLQSCEVGIVHAASGNKEGARRLIREVQESDRRQHAPGHSFRMARIY